MRSEGDTMPSLGWDLFILSPLLLYPVVDFIFRIANGLIAPDLRSEFDLKAAELGFISSVFSSRSAYRNCRWASPWTVTVREP